MELFVTRHREFRAKYVSERILKIGYHLLKLCPKSKGVVFYRNTVQKCMAYEGHHILIFIVSEQLSSRSATRL